MKYLLPLLIVITMYSCNEADKTSSSATTVADSSVKSSSSDAAALEKCEGYANVYITEELGEIVTDRFAVKYVHGLQNGNNLKTSEFIKKELLEDIYSALKDTAKGFDGLRIYFGATSDAIKKSVFVFVPTTTGQEHPNVWGKQITTSSGYSHINMDYDGTAKMLLSNFRQEFRKETVSNPNGSVPGLSKAVWINECVFDIIHNFFQAEGKTYIGFRIHCAAYPTTFPYVAHMGNKIPNQSTIVLVPVDASGEDDWTLLQSDSIHKITKDESLKWLEALNHGELCPEKCPPQEN